MQERRSPWSQAESRTQPNALGKAVVRAVHSAVRAGARVYDRERDLPGLIRLDRLAGPADSLESAEAIVARLERALRAERNKARSGHWTYDLNRHIALRQAYVAEKQFLARWKAGRREGVRA